MIVGVDDGGYISVEQISKPVSSNHEYYNHSMTCLDRKSVTHCL